MAHFETSKFRWNGSDGYQWSFSICYPPVLGVWFYCFMNGTPCFLRVHFLTPIGGSPYLVILGARPTLLGHNLEMYESSTKLSGRPPTVKIIIFLIAYRQLPSPKAETTKFSTLFQNFGNFGKFSTLFYWKVWKLRNLKLSQIFCLLEIGNFYIFGKRQLFKETQVFQSLERE